MPAERQRGGATLTPRGGHSHPPTPAKHTLLPFNSLAASTADKLKITANGLLGCAGPSQHSRGSSRPPALGRDGSKLWTLPAVGRARQDLPAPLATAKSILSAPAPLPLRAPDLLGSHGAEGKAVPASNEMINL